VVLFEDKTYTSDAAEAVGGSFDLVVGFSYECEGPVRKVIFSTRSHSDFDCAAFCRHFGGGGHTRAAGFHRVLDRGDRNPYEHFRELLFDWETRDFGGPEDGD
jgi:hypothetical protein